MELFELKVESSLERKSAALFAGTTASVRLSLISLNVRIPARFLAETH